MKHLVLLALLGLAAWPADAHAQDRKVIQNRTYGLKHEFSLHAGLIPLDVLYKAPTITGRYTWHINPYVAWEALSFTYAPTTDISLLGIGFNQFRLNHFTPQGNDLQGLFGKGPNEIDQFRMMLESNVVLKPLYGKFSMFNRSNARIELFGTGGLAVANFVAFNAYPFEPATLWLSGAYVPPLPTRPEDLVLQPGQTLLIRPGANIGGGVRWFASKRVTFRLDGRGYAFWEGYNAALVGVLDSARRREPPSRQIPQFPLDFTPLLYISAGVSISLGG